MVRRWWHPFDGMEQLSFKPVPKGFVYRAPNPWLFGPGRHYVVSEPQRAALSVHHRTMMRQVFWMIVVASALGAPLAGQFLALQSYALVGFGAFVGLVIGFVLNAMLVHKIKPIIMVLWVRRCCAAPW